MITHISIKNFKAFSDTENISLGALTLLTGINGRGKSSFLQTLLSLSQSIRNSDQHTLDNLLVNGEWVKLGNFIDIVRQGKPENEPVRFSLETDAPTDNRFDLAYVTSPLPQVGELCSFKVDGEELFSEGSFRNENAHVTDNHFSVPPLSIYTSLIDIQRMYYVAVDRKNASSEEVYGMNYSWPDKSGNNILNVIYGKGEDFQRELERKLSEIFDGATFLIKQEGSSLRLYMDSIDDGNFYRPVNVGYGYSYVLSLITCGMLAEKGEFMVIENPEAHLHPSAQSAVMKFICSEVIKKGVQVFVETHSDHIVNASLVAVRKGEIQNEALKILFFNRDPKRKFNISNLEISDKGRVKNPPKSFCDQYAIDLKVLMGF